MGVDIRLGAPLLHSHPSYPTLAVNRLRRSRSMPTAHVSSSLILPMGVLQISKGLDLLHQSAALVHANLTPRTVLINAVVSLSSARIVACNLSSTKVTGRSLVWCYHPFNITRWQSNALGIPRLPL